MKALIQGRLAGDAPGGAVFALEHGFTLRVQILEPDIGRITLQRPEGYRLDRGWSVAPNGGDPPFEGRPRDSLDGFARPTVAVAAGGGVVTLAVAGGLRAEVRLSPFGVSWFRSGEAAPFLQDRPTQAYFASRRANAFRHHLARDAAERHYGLGDKTGPLDRTGRRFRIDAVDPCGFNGGSDPLYKMIPFLLVDGPRGAHGVFWDNLAVAEVDCGATIDNYHGLFRTYEATDGDLDAYILAGPSVAEVSRRFSWLTGGQAFPPRWSLGFGMTSMTIADAPDADARVDAFIADCRRHGIACDSFHFGSGYSSIEGKRYAFHWNRAKFPDPPATLARLKAAGMRTVANLKPCLLDDHPRFHEAEAGGFLVKDGETGAPALAQFWDGMGAHLDFTNPAGRDWWRNGIETALLEPGMVSVWSDNNEFEIWDEDAVCFGDGRPFPQSLARPAQALLMTKIARDAQAQAAPHARPYVVTRAGPAGLNRYGQTWSGDNATAWSTLRENLVQGLNMSLSGLHNIGHDVGGFHGPSPGPELFCRFVEFCALWPRFVMNSWKPDGVVNTPWMHAEVLPQVREAMELRRTLMPTLYTLLWRAAVADEPVVRPLLHDFPDDPGVRDVEDAFLLGPDLLVAPVLAEGARERVVRLPDVPGGWVDWHSGASHAGGAEARVEAPLGRPPLFARAGAVVAVENEGGLALRVFSIAPPEGAGAWLYVDDGETSAWRTEGTAIRLERGGPRGGLRARRVGGKPGPRRLRVLPTPSLDLPAEIAVED